MTIDRNVNSEPTVTDSDFFDLTSPPLRRAPRVRIKSPRVLDGEVVEVHIGPTVFEAVARDLRDGDLSSQIHWSTTGVSLVDKDFGGSLGVGAKLEVTLPPGEQTVTARVKDSDGMIGLDSVAVAVCPPVIEKLESDTEEDETGSGGGG